MSPEIIQLIADAGIAGLSLGAMGYLFLQMMKAHRSERDEFREDIKGDRARSDEVLSNLTDVIRDINRD